MKTKDRSRESDPDTGLHYREVFENSGEGIFFTEPDGTIVSANPEACRILGRTESEIINLGRSGILDQKDPRLPAALEERSKTGRFHGELNLIRNDGTTFPCEVTSTVFRDSEGKTRTSTIIRDITAEKKDEEALRINEERYRRAQEVGHVGSWEFDIKNNSFWGSEEGKRIYGFTSETDVFTAEEVMTCVVERERVDQAMIDLIEKNHPYNIEFEIIPRGSTERRTIQSIAELLRDAEGNPIRVTGVLLDITVRKRNEEQLKRSQMLLRSSLEAQKDTILFSIDKEYRYLYFNQAHANAMKYAYNREVEIGMNILECITSGEDRKAAKENYDRALGGESHTNIRVFGDINPAYYESFFNPIVDEHNEIFGATGLARNITERKAVEEGLTKQKEQLEYLNSVFIDRELRMIELKKEINDLLIQSGHPKRY